MYRRAQFDTLLSRMDEPRQFIQVVVGPRQVGKSTMVTQVLEAVSTPHLSFNADHIDENDADWVRRCWEGARALMQLQGYDQLILVIDEIQKISNWSEAVKREWDSDTMAGVGIKLILLGSSRLMIRKGLTESLAGRFELIRMGHWGLKEMGDAFGLSMNQWIYFGGYPGTASMMGTEHRWRRYVKDALVAPAIEKDVMMTSRIYKPALMVQLFEMGCSYSAELLSLTKMLGQLQDAGNVTTLQSYLNVLRECHLITGLQKYAHDKSRRYQSVPKFQVYNNALLTAFHRTSYGKVRTDPMMWGRWVESAVGVHLMSKAEEEGYGVYYWRERNDEVDYIVDLDGELTAIEVKSGKRGTNKGLPLFAGKFHPCRALVVGTDGLPLEEFFRADMMDILSLPASTPK